MKDTISQGEVWDADFGETEPGTERPRLRPVIVLSRSELNKGRSVLVVPLTSKKVEIRSRHPNNVFLPSGAGGLTVPSVAQTELASAIDQEYLVTRRGRLSDEQFSKVLQALMWTVDYYPR